MTVIGHSRFARDENGTVLVETLIAIPVLTLLTFGIFEFGHMMWQREQLQIGVRDAARYWTRCRQWNAGPDTCDLTVARNIAFYGDPRGGASGSQRVPGWNDAGELVISPVNPPAVPTAADVVIVHGQVEYQGSPAFEAIFGSTRPTIAYQVEMRYQGW